MKVKFYGKFPVEFTGERVTMNLDGRIRVDGLVVAWLEPQESIKVLDKDGWPMNRYYSEVEISE